MLKLKRKLDLKKYFKQAHDLFKKRDIHYTQSIEIKCPTCKENLYCCWEIRRGWLEIRCLRNKCIDYKIKKLKLRKRK